MSFSPNLIIFSSPLYIRGRAIAFNPKGVCHSNDIGSMYSPPGKTGIMYSCLWAAKTLE
jgi:hypothetical protein